MLCGFQSSVRRVRRRNTYFFRYYFIHIFLACKWPQLNSFITIQRGSNNNRLSEDLWVMYETLLLHFLTLISHKWVYMDGIRKSEEKKLFIEICGAKFKPQSSYPSIHEIASAYTWNIIATLSHSHFSKSHKSSGKKNIRRRKKEKNIHL